MNVQINISFPDIGINCESCISDATNKNVLGTQKYDNEYKFGAMQGRVV